MLIKTSVSTISKQPKLHSHAISISNRILTIAHNSNNGNFVTEYVLYDGDAIITTIPSSTNTIDLDEFFDSIGSHSLSVVAKGTNFKDSNKSNAITYALFYPTISITNGHLDPTTSIYSLQANTLLASFDTSVYGRIEPDFNYVYPSSATIVGASYAVYNSTNGGLAINIGNNTSLSITAACLSGTTTLDMISWQTLSDNDTALANYFTIGDIKSFTLGSPIGAATSSDPSIAGAYIIGFNHNSAIEGTGTSFQLFYNYNDSKESALIDGAYGQWSSNVHNFIMNPTTNAGGWKDSTIRYYVLGSVESLGQQNATGAAKISPVPGSLMAALPEDFRAVLKPMTKFTDNVAGQAYPDRTSAPVANVTSTVDYIALPAEFELFGGISQWFGYGNAEEANRQAWYTYYDPNSGGDLITHIVKYYFRSTNYAHIVISGTDPYFFPHFKGNTMINPVTTQWVSVKYRANSTTDGSLIEIYASNPAFPGASYTITGNNNWNVAVFSVKDVSNWNSNYGDRTRIRFDPIEGAQAVDNAEIDIAWIAFFESESDAYAFDGTQSNYAAIITPDELAAQAEAADANNIKSITSMAAVWWTRTPSVINNEGGAGGDSAFVACTASGSQLNVAAQSLGIAPVVLI